MRVAVITVGDELLAGDIENTNATWLCRELTERGATVARVTTLPDDVDEIAATVREFSDRFDAVVVTGGLGPTHDDVTMDAVAAAFDRELTEHPDVVAFFDDHDTYAHADLTPGTTHLPAGSQMLANDVGVAPGCVCENVYVLPGVPAEMKSMFAGVAEEFGGERRHVAFVHAAEPESELVGRLDEVRERFDVVVGSYPGDGVRIKVQSTDADAVERAATWLRDRVTQR